MVLLRTFLCLVLSSILLGCNEEPEPDPVQATPPNIIFVLADDLGYGDLGVYGQQNIETPVLDQMAAEGIYFTQHYAGSTVCAPSRSALMQGLHTGHTRVRGNYEVQPMGQYPLQENDTTMAEVLKSVGYTTGLIGKWGLGGPESTGIPNRKGFDYFFGYLGQRHAHNYYPEFLFRNEERVPLEGNRVAEPRPDGAGVAVERAQYSHDLFVEEALRFIDQNSSNPFFLMLTLTIPHANNEAGELGMEVPDYGAYGSRDWPDPQKGHAAMISRMDRDIGRIFERLDSLGLDEQTLVIFTSDNGPHREGGNDPDFNDSNGPLRGIKRDLYEGGIRVPMIARWPGTIEAGTMSDHVSAFWDFLPTFAELAYAEMPSKIDGLSMANTFYGEQAEQKVHTFLYWEFHEGPASKQAVRMGDWKGVRHAPDQPLEIYNLHDDIGEQNNLAEEHPEIAERIEAYMEQTREPSEHWELKSSGGQ